MLSGPGGACETPKCGDGFTFLQRADAAGALPASSAGRFTIHASNRTPRQSGHPYAPGCWAYDPTSFYLAAACDDVGPLRGLGAFTAHTE